MEYINEILEKIKKEKDVKFYEATSAFLNSISNYIEENEELFRKKAILEKLTTPDRIIQFKVSWIDDNGINRVNNGYRVQFNNALGTYKGGLRFHPTVDLDTLKFLGFEQTFKNALTNLPIGGAKGGSDFNPKGKSDNEILNFCKEFMNELYKYIGPYTDVPAGDIGVSGKEIGYLFGHYKKLTRKFDGTISGKPNTIGGLLGRSEATGYGLVYFLNYIMRKNDFDIKDKKILISGSGNVAIYAIEKASELKAKCITASDSNGFIYDENGIDVNILKDIKLNKKQRISEYVKFVKTAKYFEGEKPWNIKADIALPCATENEINKIDAMNLLNNGIKYIAEGANMPTDNEAKDIILNSDIVFLPAKASNAGGVMSSVFEMSQDSNYIYWNFKKSDDMLKENMEKMAESIYNEKIKNSCDYQTAANLISFKKVVDAIIIEGI